MEAASYLKKSCNYTASLHGVISRQTWNVTSALLQEPQILSKLLSGAFVCLGMLVSVGWYLVTDVAG